MKTIQIHGKNYVPVSERIKEAGDNLREVETTIMQHEPVVVIKATIFLKNGNKFTGISSANPAKLIEKTNPYEVAETSAIGRALGFAGYGIDEGIASADEVKKYPEDNYGDAEVTKSLEETSGCNCHTKSQYHSKTCPLFGKKAEEEIIVPDNL